MKRTSVATYISGTTIAAGILASGSAHAQLIYQSFTNETVTGMATSSGNQSLDFNLDPIQASIDGSGEFFIDTYSLLTSEPKLSGNPGGTEPSEVSSTPIASGMEIGSGTTFNLISTPSDGPNQFYGLSLSEGDGTHYGYVEFTQSTDMTTGDITETINALAVQGMPNVAITAGATPEPGTLSLLALGALGATGLVAYRRRFAAI